MKFNTLKKTARWLRISGLILLPLLFCTHSFAALGGNTVWEVRAEGADTNGGGFNPSNATPGTDFTQQDAAQDSGTDLASADGDASPCVVTSATHNFVDADEGNLINITEAGDGFTLGYYEIVSTATNAATLDRACGSDGAKTGGDWAYGGALLTIQEAMDNMAIGNDIYVKKGTYAEALTPAVSGGNGNLARLVGYDASRAVSPTGANRPDVTGSDTRANCMTYNKAGWEIKNIRFHNATGDGITGSIAQGNTARWINCQFDTNGGAGWAADRQDSRIIGCEFNSNTGNGLSTGNAYARTIHFCYSHDNGGVGFNSDANNFDAIYNSIADTNTGTGFDDFFISNNNVAYGNGSFGFYLPNGESNDPRLLYFNNIANGNTGVGFRLLTTSYHPPYFDYNQYDANSGDSAGVSTNSLSNITAGEHDVSGVASGFTDAAGGDFSLATGSANIDTGLDNPAF